LVERFQDEGEHEQRPCRRYQPIVDPGYKPKADQKAGGSQHDTKQQRTIDRPSCHVTSVGVLARSAQTDKSLAVIMPRFGPARSGQSQAAARGSGHDITEPLAV